MYLHSIYSNKLICSLLRWVFPDIKFEKVLDSLDLKYNENFVIEEALIDKKNMIRYSYLTYKDPLDLEISLVKERDKNELSYYSVASIFNSVPFWYRKLIKEKANKLKNHLVLKNF